MNIETKLNSICFTTEDELNACSELYMKNDTIIIKQDSVSAIVKAVVKTEQAVNDIIHYCFVQ